MAQIKSRKKLNMTTVTVLAAVCVVVCTVILTSMTFGWFSSSVTAKSNTISAGAFSAEIKVTSSNSLESANPTVSEQVSMTDNTLSLESDKKYTVTITVNDNSADGYVTIKIGSTPYLYTSKMSTSTENGCVNNIIFTIDAKTDANIVFECGWQKPTSGTEITDSPNYTVNDDTLNSAQYLAENTPIAISYDSETIRVPYIIDPVSGFLYELATGNYINALNGEIVEPTTGFAYDESGNYLVHSVTDRLVYLVDGMVYDTVTDWETDVETGNLKFPVTDRYVTFDADGNLVDVLTGWITVPESGYLIHPISARPVTFDEENNLLDAETFWFVDTESGYLVHPVTGNLVYINENSELIDLALGITVDYETGLPAAEDESVTEPTDDENSEFTNGEESETIEDDDEIIEGDEIPTPEVIQQPETVTYYPLDFYYNILDIQEYQLVPGYVEDLILGKTYTLYNTVDFTTFTLSLEHIDPATGFYMIPGSVYEIVPATGYLYNTVDGFYADPATGYFVNPEVALGIVSDDPVTDTSTDTPADNSDNVPSDNTVDNATSDNPTDNSNPAEDTDEPATNVTGDNAPADATPESTAEPSDASTTQTPEETAEE